MGRDGGREAKRERVCVTERTNGGKDGRVGVLRYKVVNTTAMRDDGYIRVRLSLLAHVNVVWPFAHVMV